MGVQPVRRLPVTLNPFSPAELGLWRHFPSYLFSTPITDLFNDMSLTTGTGGERIPLATTRLPLFSLQSARPLLVP